MMVMVAQKILSLMLSENFQTYVQFFFFFFNSPRKIIENLQIFNI